MLMLPVSNKDKQILAKKVKEVIRKLYGTLETEKYIQLAFPRLVG